MNSEKSARASLAKYQKRKLVLSLYRSKAERKCKRLYLAAKRKNSSGEPNIQVKLARLDNCDSPSNIGHHSINIVEEGVVLESANLCNPILPTINSSTGDDRSVTLKDRAQEILTDKSLLDPLIDKLYKNELLVHYLAHFEEISSGRLSPMNVAVLFGLERAYWQTLSMMTNMVYKDVTRRWYAICERLYGGSYINLCSGSKNFGQVITQKTKRGKYDPNKSKINFAVPHR